jgi:hypothetical protein
MNWSLIGLVAAIVLSFAGLIVSALIATKVIKVSNDTPSTPSSPPPTVNENETFDSLHIKDGMRYDKGAGLNRVMTSSDADGNAIWSNSISLDAVTATSMTLPGGQAGQILVSGAEGKMEWANNPAPPEPSNIAYVVSSYNGFTTPISEISSVSTPTVINSDLTNFPTVNPPDRIRSSSSLNITTGNGAVTVASNANNNVIDVTCTVSVFNITPANIPASTLLTLVLVVKNNGVEVLTTAWMAPETADVNPMPRFSPLVCSGLVPVTEGDNVLTAEIIATGGLSTGNVRFGFDPASVPVNSPADFSTNPSLKWEIIETNDSSMCAETAPVQIDVENKLSGASAWQPLHFYTTTPPTAQRYIAGTDATYDFATSQITFLRAGSYLVRLSGFLAGVGSVFNTESHFVTMFRITRTTTSDVAYIFGSASDTFSRVDSSETSAVNTGVYAVDVPFDNVVYQVEIAFSNNQATSSLTNNLWLGASAVAFPTRQLTSDQAAFSITITPTLSGISHMYNQFQAPDAAVLAAGELVTIEVANDGTLPSLVATSGNTDQVNVVTDTSTYDIVSSGLWRFYTSMTFIDSNGTFAAEDYPCGQSNIVTTDDTYVFGSATSVYTTDDSSASPETQQTSMPVVASTLHEMLSFVDVKFRFGISALSASSGVELYLGVAGSSYNNVSNTIPSFVTTAVRIA